MNQTITISQMDIAREMQNRMKKEQADKVRNYKTLNRLAKKGQILFTGSSLMEQFPIQELALRSGFPISCTTAASAAPPRMIFSGKSTPSFWTLCHLRYSSTSVPTI